MKKQSGFTLIELMIVVAIIAILAAIALPAYQQYTRQARYSDLQTAADGLKTNVSVCYAKTGTLTTCTTEAQLGITFPSSTNVSAATITGATDFVQSTTSGGITINVSGGSPVGLNCIVAGTTDMDNGNLTWDMTDCTYDQAVLNAAG